MFGEEAERASRAAWLRGCRRPRLALEAKGSRCGIRCAPENTFRVEFAKTEGPA